MKKSAKYILITVAIILALVALFAAAWFFIISPMVKPGTDSVEDIQTEFERIDEETEHIDFDADNGMLYVNNEIVVFFEDTATESSIENTISKYNAQVDGSMADIGIYKFIFDDNMTYEQLEELAEKLSSEYVVERAYINPVIKLDDDSTDDDSFVYRDPVYPDDNWNGASWNVSVPRDENWGMEAINAPGAWGYLDQMSNVKIGMIDSTPDPDHDDLNVVSSSIVVIDEYNGTSQVVKNTLSPGDHGTHVAGIMNALWNNDGEGVSGVVDQRGQLYHATYCYYTNGSYLAGGYATGFCYLQTLKSLIDNDVQVINISQNTSRLIGFAASRGNENAINYLQSQAAIAERGISRIISDRKEQGKSDFLICVAAGNNNAISYFIDSNQTYGYRELTDKEIRYGVNRKDVDVGDALAIYNNFLNMMTDEEVMGHVIVVGSVGIDGDNSTSSQTRYKYSYFSNVGDRVDIVAPGENIYSSYYDASNSNIKYKNLSGTSMATPHVAGVAGLVFASNPNLSGPEVKEILKSTAVGRFYYTDGYSGLLDAKEAVVYALKTREEPGVNIIQTKNNGLDLCFVIDTTGSMGDDIDNAKANMEVIMEGLSEKTENYRVALIDYRDFSDRTGAAGDYPSRIRLDFTDDNSRIISAIRALDLGDGGDEEETVYSGLMAAVGLDWRSDAKKVIIILGDAAPLDPEPVTNYTFNDVLVALYNADIGLDMDLSDDIVTDPFGSSMINVYSIGADASDSAENFFIDIAESTGGSYAGVEDASEVSDAIMSSIDQIQISSKIDSEVDFKLDMAKEQIDLFTDDGEYLFSFETDRKGKFVIESIEPGRYVWSSNGIYSGGELYISSGGGAAEIETTNTYWFTHMLKLWQDNRVLVALIVATVLAICVISPVSLHKLSKIPKKEKTVPGKSENPATNKELSTNEICPHCGSEIRSKDAFCTKCGKKIPRCPTCGAIQTKLMRFCTQDGTPIPEDIQAIIPMKSVTVVSDVQSGTGSKAADGDNPAPVARDTEKRCPHCGNSIKRDARFCNMCGNRIED